MGNLYVVATPIGNLEDISLRAARILNEVDFVATEDTRKTGLLISLIMQKFPFLDLRKKNLISYYEERENQRIPMLIDLMEKGSSIALVSDAGTPAISDPGFRLIREAINRGIKVISIPGPCSVIEALTSSGFPTDKFTFIGFLPEKRGNRIKLLANLKKSDQFLKSTYILFVSPFKLLKTFEDIIETLGSVDVVVARELTKVHEEIIRGKIAEVKKHFLKIKPKGEIVLLLRLG